MQKYEMMILYKPLLLEDIKKNTIQKLQKFVEKNKGTLSEVDNLGKRLLSYPINKFEEGHYIQYNLELPADNLTEFKKELTLADNVLRFLIIKQ